MTPRQHSTSTQIDSSVLFPRSDCRQWLAHSTVASAELTGDVNLRFRVDDSAKVDDTDNTADGDAEREQVSRLDIRGNMSDGRPHKLPRRKIPQIAIFCLIAI